MNILVLNPGSATLKFALYHLLNGEEALIARGIVDRLGLPNSELRLDTQGQPTHRERLSTVSLSEATVAVLRSLEVIDGTAVDAIGCRVVHGGNQFIAATHITKAVLQEIRALSVLAPLHNPGAADTLEACLRLLPKVPAVAVFDTAFHRSLPLVARTYALPFELCEQHGLYRYGFHGIAHRYVSERLIEQLNRTGQDSRCITCHLGSGASICAVRDGHSIDISMGLTPMEGLAMGTRSGDVDPGLLLYLLQRGGFSAEALDDLLNHKSGLLGLSGRSADVRDLEKAAEEGEARSELALEVFAYRVAKTIGAYTVSLEGLDGLAFSGGIGEHSASMRSRICRRLGFLGICLEPERNNKAVHREQARISADTSLEVWTIPAEEEQQIARDTSALLLETPQ